jgi:hypothetical protein
MPTEIRHRDDVTRGLSGPAVDEGFTPLAGNPSVSQQQTQLAQAG